MKHPMLATHGLVAAVCAVVGVGFSYDSVFLLARRPAAVCDRSEREVAPNGQRSIVLADGTCEEPAGGASTSLSLKDARGRVSAPFLVYDIGGPDAVVSWTAPNVLLIDISNPEDITYARDEFDGIKIRYHLHWTHNDHPGH